MTENAISKVKEKAIFFQTGLTADCMPLSDEEKAKNITIASRLKNILEERFDNSLGLAPVPFLFVNRAIDGSAIGIGKFSSNKQRKHIDTPKGFVFPLYDVGENRTHENRFINSTDKKVYCLSVGYLFNDQGQAVKYSSVDRESDPFYKKVLIRKKLAKIKTRPGELVILSRLERKDYSKIEDWLVLIESGKCIEHPMSKKKRTLSST